MVFYSNANQNVYFYNTEGKLLNPIRKTEWYPTVSRFSPLTTIKFHPEKVILATGAADSCIELYSIDPKR